MRLPIKLALVLATIATTVLGANSAMAHRFNTTIVLADSDKDSPLGKDFSAGFMLATTEQDGHPDEESDGHLGGLDVYVTVIDQKQGASELEQIVASGEAGIVVVYGSETTFPTIAKTVEGNNASLMLPGKSPFSDPKLPGVSAFIENYTKAYGKKPTAVAADGYNAARRVDVAIRINDSADDIAAIQGSFAKTADNFVWDNY